MAAVLLVLPAVNLGFGGLIPHYERWAEVLSGHVDQFQFYAVFNLYPIHDLLTPVMTQVQIGSILALAVLFVLNYRKFGRFDFRLGSLGLLVLVPVDLICPSPVMRFLCDTVQLNIYCFTFTWLRMIYVTFLRPTEGPDFLGEPADRQADGKICG